MRNNLVTKILTGLVVTVFSFLNTAALAVDKPALRAPSGDTIRLKADVSISDSTEPVTLSLRDSDVKQVLRMFADKAGMNIMFDNSVSGNITVDLVNMPFNDAFEMIMNMARLNYYVTNNTLIIAAVGADINLATQEIYTVPVKYVNAQALANFLNSNIFSMGKPGLSNKNVVSINAMTNELLIMGTENDAIMAKKMVEKFDRKPITDQVAVSHTTPAQMADMICNMLIPSTTAKAKTKHRIAKKGGVMTGAATDLNVQVGGGVVACSEGRGGVVPFQSLTITYFPQLGTIGITGGSPEQHQMVKDFIIENDKKQKQAYLEVSIVELNESGSKELTNTWQYIGKNFSFNWSNGVSNMNKFMPFFLNGDTYPVYKDDDPTTPAYYMSKYDGPTSLVYAINYLVENKKGRVVANPKILMTNGQTSTIDLTSDYVKSQSSQFMDSVLSGAVQRSYNIGNDNGINISVTPFISPDGYVTLNINPNYSTIASQITTPSAGGPTYPDDIQVTLLQRRNLDLKNIRIKDGETLIIGGLISESDTKTVKKIPFLGDIPGLGMFFRSSVTSRMKQEMIIMLTPKIIIDDEDIATTL